MTSDLPYGTSGVQSPHSQDRVVKIVLASASRQFLASLAQEMGRQRTPLRTGFWPSGHRQGGLSHHSPSPLQLRTKGPIDLWILPGWISLGRATQQGPGRVVRHPGPRPDRSGFAPIPQLQPTGGVHHSLLSFMPSSLTHSSERWEAARSVASSARAIQRGQCITVISLTWRISWDGAGIRGNRHPELRQPKPL